MEKLTKNQIILISVIVLLAAAVGAFLIYRAQSVPKTPQMLPNETAQTETPATSTQQIEDPAQNNAPASPVAQPSALSYNDALKIYANKRIQFDANCQVTPYSVTFKNGTKVMLDNRFNQARSIYLNNVQYYLGPYGFKIITLSTSRALPYTISVDCGTRKNNGTIILL